MAKPLIKRPSDPIQLAKMIGDIATGQTIETEETPRSKASRLGGLKGGIGRAKALTPEQRSAIAKKAAGSRWAIKKK